MNYEGELIALKWTLFRRIIGVGSVYEDARMIFPTAGSTIPSKNQFPMVPKLKLARQLVVKIIDGKD